MQGSTQRFAKRALFSLTPSTRIRAPTHSTRGKLVVMASTDPDLTVGYWNIKGLGAPIRAMLMYAGKEFKNATYMLGENSDGGFDASSWFKGDKPPLKEKNPLMNLPYIIDKAGGKEIVIAQSNAIMQYLGEQLNLWGTTAEEAADRCTLNRAGTPLHVILLRNSMVRHCYGPTGSDKEQQKALIAGAANPNFGSLQKLEKVLAANLAFSAATPFLVGGHATAPDFHLWEMLDQYSAMAAYNGLPPLLEPFPRLAEFHSCFGKLPANGSYMSSAFNKLPFNNKSAGYGSTSSGDAYLSAPEQFPDTAGVY